MKVQQNSACQVLTSSLPLLATAWPFVFRALPFPSKADQQGGGHIPSFPQQIVSTGSPVGQDLAFKAAQQSVLPGAYGFQGPCWVGECVPLPATQRRGPLHPRLLVWMWRQPQEVTSLA